ncbi:uncharacterized protein LOC120688863 [Panicum virgatum]|uniref:uncharacterized protein LOC120688863 n=1 Tax=Panicum virgatum TaxID=38727 RepID=UPI0019D51C8E|nr:uncharacterized protein LOC120688863 [Panicum virgatum]
MESVRVLLALAAQDGWRVHHMDVKSAFLNGDLKEVYVRQPSGFAVPGEEGKVYRLRKALYGLRQAPRAWNAKLDATLKEMGFQQSVHEAAMYRRGSRRSVLLVGVYVDDLVIAGADAEEVEEFMAAMKQRFDMSDLGLLSFYLGIEVRQSASGISLSQAHYAKRILELGDMVGCNSVHTPMEEKLKLSRESEAEEVDVTHYRRLVGSLRYLVHTRPDLAFAVGYMSRFMERPTAEHLQAVKRILRYVAGTLDYGLVYKRIPGTASFVATATKVVALSSCEAEYIAAASAATQALWLSRLLGELLGSKVDVVELKVDNKSALALAKNPVFHGRSKHIRIKYHFIKDCLEDGSIKAIPSHSTRRAIFDHYVRTRAEEERKEKRAAQKAAVEAYKELLEEASEDINEKTAYPDFKRKWGADSRFEALDRKEREALFNEKVKAIQEKVQSMRKAVIADFKSMLRESKDITSASRWTKVKENFRSDPRYKATKHEERETIFNEYIAELKSAEQEVEQAAKAKVDEQAKLKERERETRKRKEREEQEMERVKMKIRRKEAVSSYQALLVEMIKDPKVSWTESKPKLEKDPQGRALNPDLGQGDAEKLFRDHVKDLYERCVRDFRALLSEVITPEVAARPTDEGKTAINSWSEAKCLLRSDPRYNKLASKDRESIWRRYADDLTRKLKQSDMKEKDKSDTDGKPRRSSDTKQEKSDTDGKQRRSSDPPRRSACAWSILVPGSVDKISNLCCGRDLGAMWMDGGSCSKLMQVVSWARTSLLLLITF